MAEASVKDSNSWQAIEEERPSMSNIFTDSATRYRVPGIRRDDGLTVTREGMSREKWEYFSCTGDFGQFRFTARRWDEQNKKPLDVYTVHVRFSPSHNTTKADEEQCRSHMEDIKSALLNFPVMTPFFNKMPVKDVLFDIGQWTEPQIIRI